MTTRTNVLIGLGVLGVAVLAALIYRLSVQSGDAPRFTLLQNILDKYFKPGTTTANTANQANTASSAASPPADVLDVAGAYDDFVKLMPAASPYTSAMKACASNLTNDQKATEMDRALQTLLTEFDQHPERMGLTKDKLLQAINSGFKSLDSLGRSYIERIAGMALVYLSLVAKVVGTPTDWIVYNPATQTVQFKGKWLDDLRDYMPGKVAEYNLEGAWKNKDYAAPFTLGELAVLMLLSEDDQRKREDRYKTFEECAPCDLTCHEQTVKQ